MKMSEKGNYEAPPPLKRYRRVEEEDKKEGSEIYIQSTPNNSNETYTFMGLGRAGRFGQS